MDGADKPAVAHLVEQGLEQVVVAAVDNGEIDRRASQGSSGGQATKTTTDDEDARARA